MSLISRLKLHQLKPIRFNPAFYTLSNRSPITFIKHFCSTNLPNEPVIESVPETVPKPEETAESEMGTVVIPEKLEEKAKGGNAGYKRISMRGKEQNPEKFEDIICRMMSGRAWTTRLQNSIRNLVPAFDETLVLNVLKNARKADQALQFFRWVERSGLFRHTKDTHMMIIEILGRASMLNHAREILMDMPKKGVEWNEGMFESLIDSYGKSGIVQESVKIFDQMKELGVERSVVSYDVLFKVILRRGRYMMAKRYYNKMLEEGIAPTKRTFSLLLWGFFLCRKETTAKRFYEDMISRGIMPDEVTYNTLINGFYRLNKIEEAEKLFVEMKRKKISPSVISYNTMIKGYANSGKVDDAFRMFVEMKGKKVKPDAVTYTTLLPGLCDAMKISGAQMVLNEMVQRHIFPKDNSVFIKLLNCQSKLGDLGAMRNVLTAMIRLRVPTEAGHYGVLIENFCKNGVYDVAVKLFDTLIEKEIILRPQSTLDIQPNSYNVMIEHLCENGQTGKAETFFRQLMKKGILDSTAFNNLIKGHSKEGNPESAFEIQKIMIKRGVLSEPDSYTLLIKSFLEKREPADAKMALDSMIENGHTPDSSLFRIVMEGLFNDERIQTASRVLKTMLEKGVKDHMDLAQNILEKLLLRGHTEEAIGRIELLLQNGCDVNVDRLLSVLSEKGKTIPASKLLHFALDRNFTLEFDSYDKVLDALLAAGKTVPAYSILCKISSKGGKAHKKNLESLIKTLNEEGNTKQADILGRLMNDKISSKGGESPRKGKTQSKEKRVLDN